MTASVLPNNSVPVCRFHVPACTACPQRRLRLFRRRDHQSYRVFGNGRLVHAGRVEHRDLPKRRVLLIDRVQADAVLRDDFQLRAGRQASIDHLRVDLVVAVEQSVEAVVLLDQLKHLRFIQGSTCANDLESAGREQIVMDARRVLITRR